MAHSTTEEEPEDQVDAENEEDSEADAEGEVEDDSEADAEGEDDDEIVGAVKTRSLRRNSRNRKRTEDDEDDEDEDAEAGENEDSDSDSSGSGGEKDWEAADEDVADKVEASNGQASLCTYVDPHLQ